jgi:tetratricopeptide (TPR) repeat protein
MTTMTNHFDSGGGDQNVGQGDHAIGKQVNVTQEVRGHGNAVSGTGNVTVNYGGIPPALFAEYASKLAVTDSALASFFKILEEQQVPPGDLDSKLREIATQYKELLARVGDDQAAKQAIEAGDYAKAEALLEDIARHHSLAAAGAYADNARLQRVRLRYAKAAAYWQKAAALLPEESKKEGSLYLHNAGYDLDRVARYSEALPLYEQSLRISRELGDKSQEGATLNNIAGIYRARGDYTTALKYLEQNLVLFREIGDKAHEGGTLNNISGIHWARGDYATALKYLEQSLRIQQEIGDKAGEAVTSWNIGLNYKERGELAKAEAYMSRTVQLDEEIGHPDLESDRTALEKLRAQLRGR